MAFPSDVQVSTKWDMKILLGNNTLSLLAGSETWTYTLALQLKKMGHQVSCFSPSLGIIAEKLYQSGIQSFSDLAPQGIVPFSILLNEKVDHNYDVIIANHYHIVQTLREKFPRTPIISTIHGIIHEDDKGNWQPEHPAIDAGVNQFVAVSEEVKDLLKQVYSIDSVIVRNFFDISRFGNITPPSPTPKKFLVNTNYSDRNDLVVQVVRDAARQIGAQVIAIGENFTPSVDVTWAIKDADVVFGMGRSVLEGVAAGRLGIVHGRWGTGGVITESSVESLRSVNFSGRNNVMASADQIVAMIQEYYNPAVLDWGKKYIAREHNVVFAAEEYVRMAEELTGRTINAPSRPAAIHPDAQPLKIAQ